MNLKFTSSVTEELDTSGVSLHAAKRLEMEAQVRVLELEQSLQRERLRLSSLRRHHYQLAGETEGWVSLYEKIINHFIS